MGNRKRVDRILACEWGLVMGKTSILQDKVNLYCAGLCEPDYQETLPTTMAEEDPLEKGPYEAFQHGQGLHPNVCWETAKIYQALAGLY